MTLFIPLYSRVSLTTFQHSRITHLQVGSLFCLHVFWYSNSNGNLSYTSVKFNKKMVEVTYWNWQLENICKLYTFQFSRYPKSDESWLS